MRRRVDEGRRRGGEEGRGSGKGGKEERRRGEEGEEGDLVDCALSLGNGLPLSLLFLHGLPRGLGLALLEGRLVGHPLLGAARGDLGEVAGDGELEELLELAAVEIHHSVGLVDALAVLQEDENRRGEGKGRENGRKGGEEEGKMAERMERRNERRRTLETSQSWKPKTSKRRMMKASLRWTTRKTPHWLSAPLAVSLPKRATALITARRPSW